MRKDLATLTLPPRVILQSARKQMSRNRRRFTLVAPSPHEVRAVRNGNTIHETYNTNVSRQYLSRKRTRTDRDLRQSCKRLYERHRESACRGADDIQMASISGKLLAISTRNLDAGSLARRGRRPYWQIATASFYNPLSG